VDQSGNTIIAGSMTTANQAVFKNRVINGDMGIDQRNAGSNAVVAASTATAGASAYTVDRFQSSVGPASGSLVAQQVSLAAADQAAIGGSASKAVVLSAVPVNGLTTYLPFDNSMTDTLGSIGAPTVVGTAYSSVCKVGQTCIDFTGNTVGSSSATNSIMYPVSIAPTLPISVSLWVYITNPGTTQQIWTFGNGGLGDGTNRGFGHFLYNNSQLVSDLWINGTYKGVGDGLAAAVITANTWTHICSTIGIDGLMKTYINGSYVYQNTASTGVMNCVNGTVMNTLWLGVRNAASYNIAYKGLIDDFRIYNRALSAAEIVALAGNVGISAVPSLGLTTQLTFDNTTIDSVGGITFAAATGTLSYSSYAQVGSACLDLTANPTAGGAAVVSVQYTVPSYTLTTTTWSLWVYPAPTTSNTQYAAITSGGSSSNRGMEVILSYSSVGVYGVMVQLLNSAQSAWAFSPTATVASQPKINSNSWSHIAATVNGTLLTLYVNGVAATPVTYSTPLAWSIYQVGNIANNQAGYAYKGLMDDVRIYNRAISPNEVAAIYYASQRYAYVLYQQPIEAQNIADLVWGTSAAAPVNVSAWIKNVTVTPQTLAVSLANAGHGLSSYINFENANAIDSLGMLSGPLWTGAATYSSTAKVGTNALDLTANPVAGGIAIVSAQYATPTYSLSTMTWSMWVYPSIVTGNTQYILMASGGLSSNRGMEVIISYSSSGVYGVMAQLHNAAQSAWAFAPSSTVASQPKIISNTWSHIAVTVDGTFITVYVNGVASLPVTYATPLPWSIYQIGNTANNQSGYAYKGLIDDVRIYNRALAAVEVATLYAANASSSITPSIMGPRSVTYTTPSIPVNAWSRISIPIAGDVVGTWGQRGNFTGLTLSLCLGSGTNCASSSNGEWNSAVTYNTSGNQVFGSSSNNFLANIGNSLLITGVQLEKGTAATQFEVLPTGVQLAQSQRYYEKSYNQADPVGTATQNNSLSWSVLSGNRPSYGVNYKTPKRATPAITIYNPSMGTAGTARNTGVASDGACTIERSGDSAFGVFWNAANTGQTLGQSIRAHYVADAEL
jgi:hypothetical protein